MRQARRRALSRRKPYQVGFGITFGVFSALCGLMLFERIILLFSIVGLGWQPAHITRDFKYGADSAIGPWDCMGIILAGLLFAQTYRAATAYRSGETHWSGFVFGFCNIAMITLFTFGLAINWAFYNPLNPGAHTINSLSQYLKSDYYFSSVDEVRTRAPGWEQLDEWIFCHAGAGVIERSEIIKPSYPLEHQRANFRARNPDHMEHFYDTTRRALHYYDLDWNLLTIHASDNWPTVRDRLKAAGKHPYDLDNDIWRYQESLRLEADTSHLPSCAGRVKHPFPPPSYAAYEN